MNERIITTQQELDNVPVDYDGRIIIKFGRPWDRAIIRKKYKYPVEAWENSSVEAWENSSVVAWENSSVVAWENSSTNAKGNSQVVDRSWSHDIACFGNARIIYDPTTALEYINEYELDHTDITVRLYKAVHKKSRALFRGS